jgi:hypothetical protein
MKKRLFALFLVSLIAAGSAFAQGEEPTGDCTPDAVVASFAEAVAGETLDEWVRNYVTGECDSSVVSAVLDLANAYTSMDGVTAQSGIIAQWASGAEATSQYGEVDWGAMQATGEPNSLVCADATTAWASASATEQAELTVTFDRPVIPALIHIYQSYYPGSITQVSVIDAETGDILPIDDSADDTKNEPCPRVFTVAPLAEDAISGVVISLDQSIGGSWNEIDAVELVGIAP